MDKPGLPELTSGQIELLCTTAEEAARKYVLSKLSKKDIESLDISVEAEGTKAIDLEVEINLILSSKANGIDSQAIVNVAVKEAFAAGESFLGKLK